MARRSNRRLRFDRADTTDRSPIGAGWQRSVSTTEGEYLVRTVPGSEAGKVYRCPGCQQSIVPGTPHLVVWPAWTADGEGGVAQRRHWHSGCWHRRSLRGGPGPLPW